MNYTQRGTTLTVYSNNDDDTISVTRTSDATTLVTLSRAEAHELAPLLSRTLRLAVSNPTTNDHQRHLFGVA